MHAGLGQRRVPLMAARKTVEAERLRGVVWARRL